MNILAKSPVSGMGLPITFLLAIPVAALTLPMRFLKNSLRAGSFSFRNWEKFFIIIYV